MEEIARSLVGAGRPIIKRPRLTRLLDEAETSVILLVAPAGYGKTTLAHEWLDGRDAPSAWYTCGPASADVAALAAGIAEAAEAVVPGASERLRTRLRVTNSPESEVDVLTELLAEDLADWPDDAWLCVDDYHFAVGSAASERFVERLTDLVPLRLIVCSRERPSWGTARRVLYGAITEMGRSALGMTHDEAREVLARRERDMPGLLALTDGWPAAIGLAAVMPSLDLPADQLPRPLYDYIVEEVYRAADAELQLSLCQLAIAPNVTVAFLDHMFGLDADRVLEHGVRLGFLTPRSDGTIDLHPLLRTFLVSRLRERRHADVDATVAQAGAFMIDNQLWDDAFELASTFGDQTTLVSLVEKSLDAMLAAGRIPTLTRWLAHGSIPHPILMAAEAETSFREGDYRRSEALALAAAEQFPDNHPWSSRALCLAGQCARFTDRPQQALSLLSAAHARARTSEARRDALWGRLALALDYQLPESGQLLSELAALPATRVEDALRIATAELAAAHQTGAILSALDEARAASYLVDKAKDPMVRTAYWNTLATSSVIAGFYHDGLEAATSALTDAEAYKLGFVIPHTLASRGASELGLRQFGLSLSTLRRSQHLAAKHDDVYCQMNVAALILRLRVCEGAAHVGLAETPLHWTRVPTPGIHAELMACRALAQSIAGDAKEAIALAGDAETLARQADLRVLTASVRAISYLRLDPAQSDSAIQHLIDEVLETGNRFALTVAIRGFPPLLAALTQDGRSHDLLRVTITEARDFDLARDYAALLGLREVKSAGRGILSKRESEVLDLVATGMKNREIAATLFISEVTVKVHVRRILAKLNVRSRTEAALLAREILARDGDQLATADAE